MTRHHPIAVTLLALLLATGCASSGVNRGDINLVSLEEEWQLGAKLARDLETKLDIVRDPTAQAALERLGERLVSQTEMRELPWQFHLVRDPQINAFNIPGGHVYVNTGLIAAADDAAEFTSVLGHEIAHGVARHGTEQLTRSYGLSIVAGLLLGNEPAAYERILAQIVATGALARYSRGAERESDVLGQRYMTEAGYDPHGMVDMFTELAAQSQRRPSSVEQFFSTHPLTEERVEDALVRARELDAAGLTRTDSDYRTLRSRVGAR